MADINKKSDDVSEEIGELTPEDAEEKEEEDDEEEKEEKVETLDDDVEVDEDLGSGEAKE